MKHEAFMLGTSKGKHTNKGFDLFITTAPIPDLNEKLIVFGQVVKGEDVVQVINFALLSLSCLQLSGNLFSLSFCYSFYPFRFSHEGFLHNFSCAGCLWLPFFHLFSININQG
jgi:hypothetical protein